VVRDCGCELSGCCPSLCPLPCWSPAAFTLPRNWRDDMKLPQAAQQTLAAIHADGAMLFVAATTLTAGAILAIVVLHMAAN